MEAHTPRSLWRIIPGWFLVLFGGLLMALSGVNLLLLLIWPRRDLGLAAGMILQIGAGAIWFASGRFAFKARWVPMVLTLLAGYGVGLVGASILWPKSF